MSCNNDLYMLENYFPIIRNGDPLSKYFWETTLRFIVPILVIIFIYWPQYRNDVVNVPTSLRCWIWGREERKSYQPAFCFNISKEWFKCRSCKLWAVSVYSGTCSLVGNLDLQWIFNSRPWIIFLISLRISTKK